MATAGGQAHALLAKQCVGAARAHAGVLGHVMPVHWPIRRLAGEQHADKDAGRLTVLPVAPGGRDARSTSQAASRRPLG